MRIFVRVLAVLSILVWCGGMSLLGLGSGFTCFDTCPSDLLGAMIRLTIECLVPGALLTGVAWLLALITMDRASHPRRYLLVLFSLPATLALGVVILLLLNGDWFLPTNETQLSIWALHDIAYFPVLLL